MSWIDGFSRCAPPGTDCIVWWDAWAVVVSIVGIGATVFLGVMTLRLGTAANAASKAALNISIADAKLRRKRDHDERLILLMRVTGEVSYAWQEMTNILQTINHPQADMRFQFDREASANLLRDLRGMSFGQFAAIGDRLHVIGNPIAARLARSVGLFELTLRAIEVASEPKLGRYPDDLLPSLRFVLPEVLKDLHHVRDACQAAVRELGLDDPHIAALAEVLRTRNSAEQTDHE